MWRGTAFRRGIPDSTTVEADGQSRYALQHSWHQFKWLSWISRPVPIIWIRKSIDQHHLSCSRMIICGLSSWAKWRAILALFALVLLYLILTSRSGAYFERNTGASPWRRIRGNAISATPADNIVWSDYAYCQYVTTVDYLCNSIMIFESLQRVGSKAARIMMYPQEWNVDENTEQGQLLLNARDHFDVVLRPIEVQHLKGKEEKDSTWSDSFTKLLAFNQTSYKRVLSLDSDSTVLQSMDELFLLPPSSVAMPRAYWLPEKSTLSSQLILVQPSEFQMNRVLEAFRNRSEHEFDMEIVNNLYGSECTVIPHRHYDLLSGEFRNEDHHLYLGSHEERWDPDAAYEEAKFIHFSDWPLPKPWQRSSWEQRDNVTPPCRAREDGTEDCRDRDRWLYIYEDFLARRERVCGSEYLPDQGQQEVEVNIQQLAWPEAVSMAE